jgi:transcriptional regulator with XRE-family HTH domain
MHPIRATLRLRNHRLTRLREDLGMSQRALADAIGINTSFYCSLETMRHSPIGYEGDWLPTAHKIADYHGVEPAYLWPDAVLSIRETVFTREVSADEASLMGGAPRPVIGPGEAFERRETITELNDALNRLPPREADMIARHMGLYYRAETYEQIGLDYNLSRTRVMGLCNRGLESLRDILGDQRSEQLLRSVRSR